MTVAAGKVKVAVAAIVGDSVIVAVNAGVAVKVCVAVEVGTEVDVSVHAAVVVTAVAVRAACSSAEGPQADIRRRKRKANRYLLISILLTKRLGSWRRISRSVPAGDAAEDGGLSGMYFHFNSPDPYSWRDIRVALRKR